MLATDMNTCWKPLLVKTQLNIPLVVNTHNSPPTSDR